MGKKKIRKKEKVVIFINYHGKLVRYIMRHKAASQAQLVTVSRSLAVPYSNILIDAKKRTIFHTKHALLEEKQVNQMHLLS